MPEYESGGGLMPKVLSSGAKFGFCVFLPLLVLSGCQTDISEMQWRPISPVEPLEMAMAKCDLASMSVDQGYFAFGSTAQVIGAQIGNAISNQMRRNEFIIKCMAVAGYRGEVMKKDDTNGSIKSSGTKNKNSPSYYPPAPKPI